MNAPPAPATDPLATPYLDPAVVEATVAIPDPVVRNVAITRGYHELAAAMGAVLGRENANWLCFGQWASAEAGRAIRGEAIPRFVRVIFRRSIPAAVAAGNAAVFGDVAPPFARFVRAFAAEPAAADPTRARAILDGLLGHPQLTTSPDLQRAFSAYTDALLLRDRPGVRSARQRAARIFVGNVSVGAHEQIVADPHVRAAVPGRWLVAVAATAHLGIRLPEGALSLNRDVPPPAYLAGAPFPAALLRLRDREALELADRFGQDPHSTIHSDAPNWEDYRERMGYIYSLLRAYQQDPEMFGHPPEPPST